MADDQSWVGTSLRIVPHDERYKSDYSRTPNIGRLAERGMRFTRGNSSAPFCCPTRRSPTFAELADYQQALPKKQQQANFTVAPSE